MKKPKNLIKWSQGHLTLKQSQIPNIKPSIGIRAFKIGLKTAFMIQFTVALAHQKFQPMLPLSFQHFGTEFIGPIT